jgi:integrase
VTRQTGEGRDFGRRKARFFTLKNVSRIIEASKGEHRVFYWLLAEAGIRASELAGLRLEDIAGELLTMNQSVWHGKVQAPKTNNALRSLGLSPQLVALLWEQIARQRSKGQGYLFSSENGTPWDMNVYRGASANPGCAFSSCRGSTISCNHTRHYNVILLN